MPFSEIEWLLILLDLKLNISLYSHSIIGENHMLRSPCGEKLTLPRNQYAVQNSMDCLKPSVLARLDTVRILYYRTMI